MDKKLIGDAAAKVVVGVIFATITLKLGSGFVRNVAKNSATILEEVSKGVKKS